MAILRRMCVILALSLELLSAAKAIRADDVSHAGEDWVVDDDFLSTLPDDQQALVSDFVHKRKNLRHVYSNMSLEASITSQRAKRPGSELRKAKDYSGSLATLDGKWFRLDGVYAGTPGVAILGPGEGFVFGKGNKTNAWFLVNRFTADSRQIDRYTQAFRFDSHPMVCGAFSRAVYKGKQPGEIIELQSMIESGEGNATIVTAKLLSRLPLENGRFHHTFTRVEFLPQLSWATKKWFQASALAKDRYYNINELTIDYHGEHKGVPLLKSSVEEFSVAMFAGSSEYCSTTYSAGPPMVSNRQTAIVTRFDPTPPSLSTFDHRPFLKAAGGLGDVLNPSRTAIIFVLNGIVLFFVGLWLFRKRSRRRTASEEITGQTT